MKNRPSDQSRRLRRAAVVSAAGLFALSACSTRIVALADGILASSTVASTSWHLVNGSDSIDLTATPGVDSTVYYAVYDVDQSTLTAEQVKDDALACSGDCVSGGSFSATGSGTTVSVSSLPDKVRYSVYAVTENAAGLSDDSEVKHYVGVLPRRLSMQS